MSYITTQIELDSICEEFKLNIITIEHDRFLNSINHGLINESVFLEAEDQVKKKFIDKIKEKVHNFFEFLKKKISFVFEKIKLFDKVCKKIEKSLKIQDIPDDYYFDYATLNINELRDWTNKFKKVQNEFIKIHNETCNEFKTAINNFRSTGDSKYDDNTTATQFCIESIRKIREVFEDLNGKDIKADDTKMSGKWIKDNYKELIRILVNSIKEYINTAKILYTHVNEGYKEFLKSIDLISRIEGVMDYTTLDRFGSYTKYYMLYFMNANDAVINSMSYEGFYVVQYIITLFGQIINKNTNQKIFGGSNLSDNIRADAEYNAFKKKTDEEFEAFKKKNEEELDDFVKKTDEDFDDFVKKNKEEFEAFKKKNEEKFNKFGEE